MNYSYVSMLILAALLLATSELADATKQILLDSILRRNFSHDIFIRPGESALMICPEHFAGKLGNTVWAKEKPVYRVLTYDNTIVVNDSRINLLPSITNFGLMLALTNLRSSDLGEYRCTVENDDGVSSSKWILEFIK